jgi:hypothetical protein
MIEPRAPRSYGRYSKRPPSISRQTAARRMAFSRYVDIDRRHSCFSLAARCSIVLCGPGCVNCTQLAPSGVLTGKHQSELDPATEEAMQSDLDVQFIFLDISESFTAGNLAHNVEPQLPAYNVVPKHPVALILLVLYLRIMEPG